MASRSWGLRKQEIAGISKLLKENLDTYIHRVPRWLWWGVAVAIAIHFYLFRELLAAYLIFSILFGILLALLLAVYLLSEAIDWGLLRAESKARAFAKRTRKIRTEGIWLQHHFQRHREEAVHHT